MPFGEHRVRCLHCLCYYTCGDCITHTCPRCDADGHTGLGGIDCPKCKEAPNKPDSWWQRNSSAADRVRTEWNKQGPSPGLGTISTPEDRTLDLPSIAARAEGASDGEHGVLLRPDELKALRQQFRDYYRQTYTGKGCDVDQGTLCIMAGHLVSHIIAQSAEIERLREAVRVLGIGYRTQRNVTSILNQFIPSLEDELGTVVGTSIQPHAARLLMALRESQEPKRMIASNAIARAAIEVDALARGAATDEPKGE